MYMTLIASIVYILFLSCTLTEVFPSYQADDYFTYYLTNPVSLWYNVSAGEEIDPAWPIDPDCDDGCATIHAHMINNTEFGYIGLGEEDVKNINKRMAMALAALKGAKGIVLDLRANDGGTDHQGAELLEFFLPEGTAPRLYEKAGTLHLLLHACSCISAHMHTPTCILLRLLPACLYPPAYSCNALSGTPAY